ncbi:MAG: electron transport complex protein RnfC, partial [Gammaproteobacteria bacterium]
MTSLHTFHGGLSLPGHKVVSLQGPIQISSLPEQMVIPIRQHIGEARRLTVEVGDRVLGGQILAESESDFGTPIHASTSGVISAIAPWPIPHPSGASDSCVIIDVDGLDDSVKLPPIDLNTTNSETLIERIRSAGIVGLGGAAFPTAIKLDRAQLQSIATLIINGAECEPYITCDDILMQEQADDIIRGIKILQSIIVPQKTLIAIEDNKSLAIKSMQMALNTIPLISTELVVIPTIYPSGGEKQLVQILTGLEIPQNQLAIDSGIYCQNVGTCVGITRAIKHNEALISRIVTLSGDGIKRPGNWLTRLGTPISHLIHQAGGYQSKTAEPLNLIMGGPMMGFLLASDQVPIVKAGNCILVMRDSSILQSNPQHDECIRCGKCTEVCPAQLLPQQLYWHARVSAWERSEQYNLFDCIECGCCSAVCPSQIPLVQYYRTAKSEIRATRRAQIKSDKSRIRFELREERLARKKQQDEERKRLKREALKKKKDSGATATIENDPVKAALERVKAKKLARQSTLANTANLSPSPKKQMTEA